MPQLPALPDPSEIIGEVVRRLKQSRYVKAAGYIYAAYNVIRNGELPGLFRELDIVPGQTNALPFREQIERVIPGFRATREQLERLEQLIGASGFVDGPDAARALVAEFPPSWLIDP